MHLRIAVVLLLVSLLMTVRATYAEEMIQSLAGHWRFAIDRDDKGIDRRLFARELDDQIDLPGSVDEAKKVDNSDQPNVNRLYRPHLFIGVAWYQRDIDIPAAWQDRQVKLLLERCHWVTQAWVDDRAAGTRDSLCVPHEYELGQLSPGKHRLTIRVDNRFK